MPDNESDKPEDPKEKVEATSTEPDEKPEEPPVETEHSIAVGGRTLEYTATAGKLPLKNKDDRTEASIFFTAYTLKGNEDAAKRPLVFVFNGGPGSSSVWLHLGALGPQRVRMQDEGWMPPPPYQLIENEHTWLDRADLVFIDPVGTGYSRTVKDEDNKKYWSLKGDLESVGKFIRLYLTRYQRWSSPLFLAGESYGTMRAAGLAGHLFERGVAFNGIVLISTVLNLQTLRFIHGNELPYVLYLPTYTATAWYHGRLPDDLQQRDLRDVLAEVEAWAAGDYTLALAKGARLSGEERDHILECLARYTGLEVRFIDHSDLRIEIHRFCKELLRDEKRTVGRLDSRFKGRDKLPVTEFPDFDPSLVAITPPYTAMLNHYMRAELGYETDAEYEILNMEANQAWEWERGEFPDTSEALRGALAKNPFMKIFLALGLYDLATPHLATHYTLDHMGIDPELRANMQTADYEAGHMLYLDVKSLAKFKTDVGAFMESALG